MSVLPSFRIIIKQIDFRSRILFVFAILIAASAPALGQSGGGVESTGTGGVHIIQGRIYTPSGQRSNARIKIKLEAPALGELSVLADANGSFGFRSLSPGSYTIVVEGGEDYETARESIYIEPERGPGHVPSARTVTVPIYLKPKVTRTDRVQPGVRDVALANVPKPAMDLYSQALESAQAGDSRKAVELLKKAVALHAEFAPALNELGVQYLKLGEPDKAADALKTAVKIDAEAFMPRLNYGIALLQSKKFQDSEKELRLAASKNDSSPVAHLYLGVVLLSLQRYDDGEKELLRAAASGRNDVGISHYYLGGLYWRKHEYSRAADELETYLKVAPQAADAERIRATITELRSKH